MEKSGELQQFFVDRKEKNDKIELPNNLGGENMNFTKNWKNLSTKIISFSFPFFSLLS